MGFESTFKHFLIVFQICGVESLALSTQTPYLMLVRAWNHILIACNIGGAVAVYIWSDAIFSDIDPIGKLTDIVQVMTPLVTYFVVLLEAVVQRNIQQQIQLHMMELDSTVEVLGIRLDRKWHQLRREFFIKFILVNCVCVSFELLIIGSFFGRGAWAFDWLVKLPCFVCNRISDLKYMLYIDCLRVYIETLNELVENFCLNESIQDTSGNRKTSSSSTRSIWAIKMKDVMQNWRLKQLKELYSRTWQLSELINNRMGRTILTTITANFIELTINLYWVYAYLHVSELVLESYYYPIPRLILVMTLFKTCGFCWNRIRQAHESIHQISRYKPALINSITLKRFCLQINHLPIVVSANDFFEINYKTLNSVS